MFPWVLRPLTQGPSLPAAGRFLPGGRQGHSLDKYRDVRVTDTTWGTHSHKWHCHFDTLLYSTSGYSYKV